MTSELQRQALASLAEVWALSPDVRLGQLFVHLGFLGEAHLGRGLGNLDDHEMMSLLVRHRAELSTRLTGQAQDLPKRPMTNPHVKTLQIFLPTGEPPEISQDCGPEFLLLKMYQLRAAEGAFADLPP